MEATLTYDGASFTLLGEQAKRNCPTRVQVDYGFLRNRQGFLQGSNYAPTSLSYASFVSPLPDTTYRPNVVLHNTHPVVLGSSPACSSSAVSFEDDHQDYNRNNLQFQSQRNIGMSSSPSSSRHPGNWSEFDNLVCHGADASFETLNIDNNNVSASGSASREADARPEVRIHIADDHDPARALIPPVNLRSEETDFLAKTNLAVAAMMAAAAFNLMNNTATDSPFLRCCAAASGIGFLGSFLALYVLKDRKLSKILSKVGAIGVAWAVCIALGITTLKGTKWYINVVVTAVACLINAVVIAMADI